MNVLFVGSNTFAVLPRERTMNIMLPLSSAVISLLVFISFRRAKYRHRDAKCRLSGHWVTAVKAHDDRFSLCPSQPIIW